ncbi:MAG: hypothetical protein ACK4GL_04300 [Flavobacteriales bacterium]
MNLASINHKLRTAVPGSAFIGIIVCFSYFGSIALVIPALVCTLCWIAPEYALPDSSLFFVFFSLSVLVHDWLSGKDSRLYHHCF